MSTAADPSDAAALVGFVEDAEGHALVGVRVRDARGTEAVFTAEEGRFALPPGPRPAALVVDDRGRENRVAVPAEAGGALRVVAVPPDAVPLRVLVPATVPVPTRYGWLALRREPGGLVEGPSGAATSSRFAVRGLSAGSWAVVVWGGPFLPSVVEPVVLDGSLSHALVTVEVGRRGASVAGRVLTPTAQPRPGALVRVVPADPALRLSDLRSTCASDAGGRWRLEGLPAGRYAVLVDLGGGVPPTEMALNLLDREERSMDLVL